MTLCHCLHFNFSPSSSAKIGALISSPPLESFDYLNHIGTFLSTLMPQPPISSVFRHLIELTHAQIPMLQYTRRSKQKKGKSSAPSLLLLDGEWWWKRHKNAPSQFRVVALWKKGGSSPVPPTSSLCTCTRFELHNPFLFLFLLTQNGFTSICKNCYDAHVPFLTSP